MKVLYLSPDTKLISFIKSLGDDVYRTTEKICPEFARKFDYIISFGYRYILSEDIIKAVNGNAINLHISYLPYNRGADPNLWSYLEDTPAGVTIHQIDKGIDTGGIIARKFIEKNLDGTLASTYNDLYEEMKGLFIRKWPKIRTLNLLTYRFFSVKEKDTYHKKMDKDKYMDLLTNGWNTPVKDIYKKAIGG